MGWAAGCIEHPLENLKNPGLLNQESGVFCCHNPIYLIKLHPYSILKLDEVPMKKVFVILSFLFFTPSILLAVSKETFYEGTGEVTSVDPLYSRVTIKHGAIKNFEGDAETEFFVQSPDLLKGITKRDLVSFRLVNEKGDVRIEKITKTGEAPLKDDSVPLGRVVQGVLVSTGEAVKTVSTPLAPAHEAVSGAVDATTDATDSVLHDASPEVKQKF